MKFREKRYNQAKDADMTDFEVAKRCVMLCLAVLATWGLYMCLVTYIMLAQQYAFLLIHTIAAILVHVNPLLSAIVYTYGDRRYINAVKNILGVSVSDHSLTPTYGEMYRDSQSQNAATENHRASLQKSTTIQVQPSAGTCASVGAAN